MKNLLRSAIGAICLLCAVPAQAAFEIGDVICETTTTTGTGTINLAGALTNYVTFLSQITSGATVPYHIKASDGKVESGIGTFTDATPDTLTRTAQWSTDGSGAELTLPAGTHTVCLGPNIDYSSYLFASGVEEVIVSSSATSPSVIDGNALGTTSLQWSDLFLAEGGEINWDNGDIEVTQVGDDLILFGGGLNVVNSAATTARQATDGITPVIQTHSANSASASTNLIMNWQNNDTAGGTLMLGKSKGAAVGTYTAVVPGTRLGAINFQGAEDGSTTDQFALITGSADSAAGTVGTDDLPGEICFHTTADGAGAASSRWCINNAGAFQAQSNGLDIDLGTSGDTTFERSAAGEATLEGDAVKHAGKQMIWVGANGMKHSALNPASCGDVYDSGTQDVTIPVCAFDTGATEENVEFGIAMPKSWNEGTVTAQVAWTNTGGSAAQTVQWKIACTGFGDDDALNTAYPADVTISDTFTATNDYTLTAETSAITVQNAAEGDFVMCRIGRDTSVDNLGGDALLIGVKLFWTDNASTLAE